MRAMTMRFRLWQIMAIVAMLAVLFAALGVIFTIAVLLIAGAMLGPVAAARPGRRLEAAAWAASLYPLLLFVFLYATWFAAWAVLGHQPRRDRDNPRLLGPIVLVPYVSMRLTAITAPYGLCISYPLLIAHIARRIGRDRIGRCKAGGLGLLPALVWLAMWCLAAFRPTDLYLILGWLGY